MMQSVTRVECASGEGEYGTDRLELGCGHALIIGHDDENVSLVGAETECERCTRYAQMAATR